MSDLAGITATVRATGLGVVGAFHPEPGHRVPGAHGTVVLLGPDGPAMWRAFRASAEASDAAPDPLDRWSRRVIDELARTLGATAWYPFGGPPWQPFQRWAAAGEGAVISPVAMQVSPSRGLWASYRGALGFAERFEFVRATTPSPCLDCPAPCLTACPVGAFTDGTYDVPVCVAHLASDAGKECHSGCLVRHACPAGRAIALPEAERVFHMQAFLRAHG